MDLNHSPHLLVGASGAEGSEFIGTRAAARDQAAARTSGSSWSTPQMLGSKVLSGALVSGATGPFIACNKRVALISTDHGFGGIHKSLQNYLSSLLNIGCHVDVILRRSAPLYKHLKGNTAEEKVSLHELRDYDIFVMKKLKRLTPNVRSMITDATTIINNNNVLSRSLRKANRHLINVCHTDNWRDIDFSDAIICLTQATMDQLHEEVEDSRKLTLLPHYYTTKAKVNHYKIRDSSGPLIVGTAGRFVDKKCFADFITAASIVKKMNINATFRMAGSGERRQTLENLAQALDVRVEFVGWVPIEEFSMDVDIFCLTSSSEQFGFVLCEMMDHGVPCIATVTNGSWDLIEHGVSGLFCPVGRPDVLANLIRELHNDSKYRMDLSHGAFHRIRKKIYSKEIFESQLGMLLR